MARPRFAFRRADASDGVTPAELAALLYNAAPHVHPRGITGLCYAIAEATREACLPLTPSDVYIHLSRSPCFQAFRPDDFTEEEEDESQYWFYPDDGAGVADHYLREAYEYRLTALAFMVALAEAGDWQQEVFE